MQLEIGSVASTVEATAVIPRLQSGSADFREAVWDEFPLPKTFVIDSNHTHQLGELPGGRILLQPQRPGHPFIFDPEKGAYSDVPLPGQYQSMMLWRRADGRFVLPLVGLGEDSDAVATFDGDGFQPPRLSTRSGT
jgi:hypothetical protein